jgi:hypothetical protein
MKKISLLIIGFLFSFQAFASSFSLTLWDSLSGNSTANIYFLHEFLTKEYKSPPIEQDGTYFFKGKKKFFGINSEETFISNGSSIYNFVGITLEGNPDVVVKQLEKALATKFIKENPQDKYSKYYRRSGTEILWLGDKKSRLIFKISNDNFKYNKNPFLITN